jgi:hypothetical protein
VERTAALFSITGFHMVRIGPLLMWTKESVWFPEGELVARGAQLGQANMSAGGQPGIRSPHKGTFLTGFES